MITIITKLCAKLNTNILKYLNTKPSNNLFSQEIETENNNIHKTTVYSSYLEASIIRPPHLVSIDSIHDV